MEGLSGLGDVMEGVMAQIRQKFKDASQHEGMIESFRAFLAAVDWTVSQIYTPLELTGNATRYWLSFNSDFVSNTSSPAGAVDTRALSSSGCHILDSCAFKEPDMGFRHHLPFGR